MNRSRKLSTSILTNEHTEQACRKPETREDRFIKKYKQQVSSAFRVAKSNPFYKKIVYKGARRIRIDCKRHVNLQRKVFERLMVL